MVSSVSPHFLCPWNSSEGSWRVRDWTTVADWCGWKQGAGVDGTESRAVVAHSHSWCVTPQSRVSPSWLMTQPVILEDFYLLTEYYMMGWEMTCRYDTRDNTFGRYDELKQAEVRSHHGGSTCYSSPPNLLADQAIKPKPKWCISQNERGLYERLCKDYGKPFLKQVHLLLKSAMKRKVCLLCSLNSQPWAKSCRLVYLYSSIVSIILPHLSISKWYL